MLAPQTIYARIKRVIAERRTGLRPSDVLAAQFLDKAPLRFNTAGKRGLSAPLNKAFKDDGLRITPAKCAKAKRVQDLFIHFWKAQAS